MGQDVMVMVLLGRHLRILLDIVAWHGEAKHMLHAKGMASHVGHRGCVVPGGVAIVGFIGQGGPQGLVGY